METRLEISRGPRGLRVHLPSGRTLDISASEAGAKFLTKMLQDADEHARYNRQQRGYIGAFPTQEITDRWQRGQAEQRELEEQIEAIQAQKIEDKKNSWRDQGIEPDAVEIKL